jgi:hypothetical protein
LAGDDTGAASRADIQIDTHAPLLRRVERRMTVDTRQSMRHFLLTGNFLRELIVCAVAFKCRFPNKTAALNAELFLRDGERISASHFRHFHALDPLATCDDEVWICRRAKEVAVETRLLSDVRFFFQGSTCVGQCIELWHLSSVTEWDRD